MTSSRRAARRLRSALEWAQVRALVADGMSEREIASRLGINRVDGQAGSPPIRSRITARSRGSVSVTRTRWPASSVRWSGSAEADLVRVGLIAIDSTKVHVNASQHSDRDCEQLAREILAEADA